MNAFVFVNPALTVGQNVAYVVVFLNQKQHFLIRRVQCISGRQRVMRE